MVVDTHDLFFNSIPPYEVKKFLGVGSFQKTVKISKEISRYKTILDRLSTILFNSECMAKQIMDYPMKPIIYCVATKLRNEPEKELNNQLTIIPISKSDNGKTFRREEI
jgi:hypothetical protein